MGGAIGRKRHRMISLEQKRLVQDSFAQIFANKAQIGASCYKHLFADCPETKALFNQGFSQQHQMLVEELALIVRAMGSDKPLPQVSRLERLHAKKGVKPEHFQPMRAALLQSIGDTLGETFTPAHADAWGAAFDHLAGQMNNTA